MSAATPTAGRGGLDKLDHRHEPASIRWLRRDEVPSRNQRLRSGAGFESALAGLLNQRHLLRVVVVSTGSTTESSLLPQRSTRARSLVEEGRSPVSEPAVEFGRYYLDLCLIHQPLGDYYSEWRAMQQLYKEGRIRAIGVSNFHPDRLVDLIDHNEITPAVNQIEFWGLFADGKNDLFTNPLLSSIADDHGTSGAQVVLRWLVQREVAIIAKSVRAERMAQNIDVFDFTLTDDQMGKISTLDTGVSLFFDHRDPATVSWLGGRRLHD